MKKIFLVVLMAVMSVSASAQLVKSRTFVEKKSNVVWFVRGGISMNNLSDHASADGFGTKVGYDFSVGFNKPVGKLGFYWGMDLGLGTRGFEYNAKGDDLSRSVFAHCIRLSPFTLGYQYALNDRLKIDAHMGAYALFDYAGKQDSTGNDRYGYEYSDNLDGHNYCRGDAGIQVGIGVWLGRFNIDLTYQRGFVTQIDYLYVISSSADSNVDIYTSGCSSNFMIRLGVLF